MDNKDNKKVAYSPLEDDCKDETVVWNAQNITFVISLVVQFLVLIFSIVTLSIGEGVPEVLTLILWLETGVQIVELVWYSIIGLLFRFGKKLVGRSCEFGIEYRYADWIFTTPVMLATLYFLLHHFGNHCLTIQQLSEKTFFVGFLILIVVFDWLMLLVGFAYEREWFGELVDFSDEPHKGIPLLLGFLFLILAFIPHFSVLMETATGEGVTLVVITIVLWLIYGVIAWMWLGKTSGVMNKNAAYNILDLFSKNAIGVTVSILALTYKEAHKNLPQCSV